MCGRYSLAAQEDELVEIFEVATVSEVVPALPRWNIAPTQEAPALLTGPEGRRLGPLRWGLIPSWAGDAGIGGRLINARSETVHRKRAFRDAFPHRRCLIPADGFYEWRSPETPGGPKTPLWIHPAAGGILTFAGIWESWRSQRGDVIHTFAILTTAANRWMETMHDRMPVIVFGADRDRWLDGSTPLDQVRSLLRPPPDAGLRARRVSTYVNRPGNEGPRCVEPV